MAANDIVHYRGCDFVADALCPYAARVAARKIKYAFAVVTSPWFSMLDLYLPTALVSCAFLVSVHAPHTTYMTHSMVARMAFLSKLALAGRLYVMLSAKARNLDYTGQRAVWLVDSQPETTVWQYISEAPGAVLVPMLFEHVM